MKKIIYFLIIIISAFNTNGYSQESIKLDEPTVGSPCPNFTLYQVDFYSKKKVDLNDFKGKWLMIDFWSRECLGCIARFPETSVEQKEFKDKVQFLMVAPSDKKNAHRQLYAHYRDKLHLEMPCAFDSTIGKRFNVGALPFLVIVDPNGIVAAVTTNIDNQKIKALLRGEMPVFPPAWFRNGHEDYDYDAKLPFLMHGNGSPDSNVNVMYRSLLTNWRPGIPRAGNPIDDGPNTAIKKGHIPGKFELLGLSLSSLYMVAYIGSFSFNKDDTAHYGNFWPNPLLETKDSLFFKLDLATGKNTYCYSLIVPPAKAKKEYMMQMIQSDLQHYFGYEVSIETRKMPYWRVIATDEARTKLLSKTKGRFSRNNDDIAMQRYSVKNDHIKDFVALVGLMSQVSSKDYEPILDETGINGDIDITVEWLLNDFKSVREALNKNGLDLVKGEKEMKCVVIRDPKAGVSANKIEK